MPLPARCRAAALLLLLCLHRPDKYESMQVVAFVQQLLSHGGYYDEQLDFIRVERVQVVTTIVPGICAGRSQLSKRLVAGLRVAVMGYPDHVQLEAIYICMLQQVRARCLTCVLAWSQHCVVTEPAASARPASCPAGLHRQQAQAGGRACAAGAQHCQGDAASLPGPACAVLLGWWLSRHEALQLHTQGPHSMGGGASEVCMRVCGCD